MLMGEAAFFHIDKKCKGLALVHFEELGVTVSMTKPCGTHPRKQLLIGLQGVQELEVVAGLREWNTLARQATGSNSNWHITHYRCTKDAVAALDPQHTFHATAVAMRGADGSITAQLVPAGQ